MSVGDEKERDATSGALFAVLPLASPLTTDNDVNNSTIITITAANDYKFNAQMTEWPSSYRQINLLCRHLFNYCGKISLRGVMNSFCI